MASVNASTPSVAVRTKIPLNRRVQGSYTLNATINGVATELLVSLYSTNVLLTCNDVADTSCPTRPECDRRGKLLSRIDAFACAVLSDDPVTLIVGGYSTSTLHVGRVSSDTAHNAVFPSTTTSSVRGVFGLGLMNTGTHETTLSSDNEDIIARQWPSFSLYLGDGSFLLANGVDDELIAREGLTPRTLPTDVVSYGWTPTIRQLVIDDVPYKYDSLLCIVPQLCTVLDTSHPYIEVGSFPFKEITGKWKCEDGPPTPGQIWSTYICDAATPFSTLGFTFGDTTFYVTGDQYTRDAGSGKRELLLVSSGDGGGVKLGRPFMEQFYSSFDRRSGVTLYCKAGVNCAPVGARLASQRTANTTTAPAPVKATESTASNGSHGLVVGLIVAGVVVVVALVACMLSRRRPAKSAAKGGDNEGTEFAHLP